MKIIDNEIDLDRNLSLNKLSNNKEVLISNNNGLVLSVPSIAK